MSGDCLRLRLLVQERILAFLPLQIFRLAGEACDKMPFPFGVEVAHARSFHRLCRHRMVQGVATSMPGQTLGIDLGQARLFTHVDMMVQRICRSIQVGSRGLRSQL